MFLVIKTNKATIKIFINITSIIIILKFITIIVLI